jgi:predicted glutamine amidotransferase
MMGYVAKAETTFPELVGQGFSAFVELSREHRDGWGVAWRRDGAIALEKAPEEAAASAAFPAALDHARARAAILHFRLASVGGHSVGNTHPFVYGTVAFAHNGSVDPEVAGGLMSPAASAELEGTTDSERYFRALLRQLMAGVEVPEALRSVAARLREAPHSSLNVLLLTDAYLYAFCGFNPAAPALAKDPDYYTLYWHAREDAVLVASSGWPEGDSWQSLGNGELLAVRQADLAVERLSIF